MTTENTVPIVGQRSAVQLLTDLIGKHPELPSAHITVARPFRGNPSDLSLLLDTPTGFEQWRVALDITSDGVNLESYGRGSWVAVTGVCEGISVTLSAHGILLTDDMLAAPRTVEVTA